MQQARTKGQKKPGNHVIGVAIFRMIVAIVFILVVVFGVSKYREQQAAFERIATRSRLADEEHDRAEREYAIALAEKQRLETSEYTEEYARDRLGMVKAGEYIYITNKNK